MEKKLHAEIAVIFLFPKNTGIFALFADLETDKALRSRNIFKYEEKVTSSCYTNLE